MEIVVVGADVVLEEAPAAATATAAAVKHPTPYTSEDKGGRGGLLLRAAAAA